MIVALLIFSSIFVFFGQNHERNDEQTALVTVVDDLAPEEESLEKEE